MNIETIEICGFPGVLKALRKPFKKEVRSQFIVTQDFKQDIITSSLTISLDKQDIELISKLVKAGDEHAKILRGIQVYADFTLNRGLWSEMDTYRLGREQLSSESTMHTILTETITSNNFEIDNYGEDYINYFIKLVDEIKSLDYSNNEKRIAIKHRIPESYLQCRTLMISYQTLRRIYFQRRNHRLPIWKEICKWIESLPYSKELITIEK